MGTTDSAVPVRDTDIAIIGMSGRFPGASDVEAFWTNIAAGTESIRRFDRDELLAAGVPPEQVDDPAYVAARPVLDDVRGFDAPFFKFSPRDATVADPQQRLFLECTWEALEAAGYPDPQDHGLRVGVFAGANLSTYMLERRDLFERDLGAGSFEVVTGNDKDALATMVAYKLNLTGPSVSVQTFCSTSLVGVHLACQSLRAGDCEMALVGGVSIRVPDTVGHLYAPGGQESPDGHVRTFDADGRGSMFGDGAATVLLKPVRAALADRDTVLAVIRGSMVNNDGTMKFGFTAPSMAGQAAAVAGALENAGVRPDDIGYVEAHGTATELGDPIEVAALTEAFGAAVERRGCVLGSVKTNVGHLDRASGVTALIKVVMAMREEVIPPTLHFRTPNPKIDFEGSPFRVSAEPVPWPREPGRPRIAGVNNLGMGGTNAHAIVQEAPETERTDGARRHHVLPVSARSQEALEKVCASLADHLDRRLPRLADTAFTLQVGRRVFDHRRVLVASSTGQAAALLRGGGTGAVPVRTRQESWRTRPVTFLISGVGEQFPGMVANLYATEPAFREHVEECCAHLDAALADHVRTLLTEPRRPVGPDAALRALRGAAADEDPRTALLRRTDVAQPAVFVAGYALAATLMGWGVTPSAMVGYSVGEYVAACLAGVLSLPDALRLVAHRAELIADLPAGGMLAVGASESALRTLLPDLEDQGVDLAADNGDQVVLAGAAEALAEVSEALAGRGVACRDLGTTHAFHSRMLDGAREDLTAWITASVTLNAPALPYTSNVTGRPVTEELVTDPGYWAEHMCSTVRFADAVESALADPDSAFVEIGPGPSLGTMVRAHRTCGPERWAHIVSTLPSADQDRPDDQALAEALGQLWLAGAAVDWSAYHACSTAEADDPAALPGRIPLPTYPFERRPFWLEAAPGGADAAATAPASLREEVEAMPRLPEEDWLYLPAWRQTAPRRPVRAEDRWLVLTAPGAAAATTALTVRLNASGASYVLVESGTEFAKRNGVRTIRPGDPDDARALLGELKAAGDLPTRLVHLWHLDAADDERAHGDPVERAVRRGLHTLVGFAQAYGDLGVAWQCDVVTAGSQRVLNADSASMRPEQATSVGACRLLPIEYPGTVARLIDVGARGDDGFRQLVDELLGQPTDRVVALRESRRWIPAYDTFPRGTETPPPPGLTRGGTYLITGGLGAVGLAMAQQLADEYAPKLVLLARTPLPPRALWPTVLDNEAADPALRRRIEDVRDLEERGAEVTVISGDVTDPTVVHHAVDVAKQRHGRLDGVLHAAGVPSNGLTQFKQVAGIDQVLAPKVTGTRSLLRGLVGQEVGFVVLFSSHSAITGGGAGQLDYCAANAYLDACAYADPLPGTRVVSVGWGEWIWNPWSDGLEGYTAEVREFFVRQRAAFGIDREHGWRALLDVLRSGEPHLIVSTQEFNTIVDQTRRFTLEDVHEAAQPSGGGGMDYPRPDLSVPYVAPRSEVESAVVAVWQDLLGLREVGVEDNFFELGGNSLIGVSAVAKVRSALGLDHLAPNAIVQAPTVSALAALIDATAAAEPKDDEGDVDRQARADRRKQNLKTRRR